MSEAAKALPELPVRQARKRRIVEIIASTFQALMNCTKSKNQEWCLKHQDHLDYLMQQFMPSGSGCDSGTKLDMNRSTADKLVFHVSFHHMNEGGMYDGWTDHVATVTPSFIGGMNLRVSGRNRNEIKNYLGELFDGALNHEVDEHSTSEGIYTSERGNTEDEPDSYYESADAKFGLPHKRQGS